MARAVGTYVRTREPMRQQSSLRDLRVSLAAAAYDDVSRSDSNHDGHEHPEHEVTSFRLMATIAIAVPSGGVGAAGASISFTRWDFRQCAGARDASVSYKSVGPARPVPQVALHNCRRGPERGSRAGALMGPFDSPLILNPNKAARSGQALRLTPHPELPSKHTAKSTNYTNPGTRTKGLAQGRPVQGLLPASMVDVKPLVPE